MRILISSVALAVLLPAVAAQAQPFFSDSFETPLGASPDGWSDPDAVWTVTPASQGVESGDGAITNPDGENVVVGGSGDDGGMVRSIDIAGYENAPLIVSFLANDHGQLDGTLEDLDNLIFEYVFQAAAPDGTTVWALGWSTQLDSPNDNFSNEGDWGGDDLVAGEQQPEEFAQFSFNTANPAGETTMWLRISQEVGNAEGYVLDLVEVEPIPEPATMALLGLGGLVALRRRRR